MLNGLVRKKRSNKMLNKKNPVNIMQLPFSSVFELKNEAKISCLFLLYFYSSDQFDFEDFLIIIINSIVLSLFKINMKFFFFFKIPFYLLFKKNQTDIK